jgi:hypothetical protein
MASAGSGGEHPIENRRRLAMGPAKSAFFMQKLRTEFRGSGGFIGKIEWPFTCILRTNHDGSASVLRNGYEPGSRDRVEFGCLP